MAVTFTYDEIGPIHKMIVAWTSDASGDAAGTSKKITGEVIKGQTNPTDTPTDDYDIVLTDEEAVNILGNSADDLVDRDTTNTEEVYFGITDGTNPLAAYPVVSDKITVTVSNAGNAKSGKLTVYYKPGVK